MASDAEEENSDVSNASSAKSDSCEVISRFFNSLSISAWSDSQSFSLKSRSCTQSIQRTYLKELAVKRASRRKHIKASFDRFIPCRSTISVDVGELLLSNKENKPVEENSFVLSNWEIHFHKEMKKTFTSENGKLLRFRSASPLPTEEAYSESSSYDKNFISLQDLKKTSRLLPSSPERVLDAPDIIDDFYLNILDWSTNNMIGLALGRQVYFWDANTSDIANVVTYADTLYVSCLSFLPKNNIVGIGLSNGIVELYDFQEKTRLRKFQTHRDRTACLCWNKEILSTGCKSGDIDQHDVRIHNHHIRTLKGHRQEVCGMTWSHCNKYLASGANDNVVNVWDIRNFQEPIFVLRKHESAVKALAWCPWQHSLLATGGGTSDRRILLTNVFSGKCISSVDTRSQISGIVWSEEYKEIASTHGFSRNHVGLWKYPTMKKVAEFFGHSNRILSVAFSPDKQTLVTAGADETLRFWRCFSIDKQIIRRREKEIADSFSTKLTLSGLR